MLPSIEKCKEIVEKSTTFKEKIEIIEGFEVHKFSYIVQTEDIITYSAQELRGITFVKYEDEFKVFPMLHKFYNVNQIPSTNIELLKEKTIKKVSTKMDGSLLGFYELPNNNIYPMTKGSFGNEVIDQVNKYLTKNNNIINFIKELFDLNLFPLFEWVSPKNRIVLYYETESLSLLQVRDSNGNYIDLDSINELIEKYKIEKTIYWANEDLNTLFTKREKIKNFEGWVIQFEDGMIVKLKTDEYFELHKTLSGLNIKSLFELIVNDDLDDYKDKLTKEGNMFVPYKKSVILEMESKVQRYIINSISQINEILEENKYLTTKDFAIKYLNTDFFPILIKAKRDNSINKLDMFKELLLKRYKTIENIEDFIDSL